MASLITAILRVAAASVAEALMLHHSTTVQVFVEAVAKRLVKIWMTKIIFRVGVETKIAIDLINMNWTLRVGTPCNKHLPKLKSKPRLCGKEEMIHKIATPLNITS